MSKSLVYKKVGRRYVPLGQEFIGFPSDGIWYVHDGKRSQTHIMKIGDLPDPRPLVELEQYRDAVTRKVLSSLQEERWSVHDLISRVFKALVEVTNEVSKDARN